MDTGLGRLQALLLETMQTLLDRQRAQEPSGYWDPTFYLARHGDEVAYGEQDVVLVRHLYAAAYRARRLAGEQVDPSVHTAAAARALSRLVAMGRLRRVWPATVVLSAPCPCCGRRRDHPRGAHAFTTTVAVILAQDRAC